MMYIRKDCITACFNKLRTDLLFLTQGTGVFESFNALYRRIVVKKGVPLPEIPDWVRQRMIQKNMRDVERDKTVAKIAGPSIVHSLFFPTPMEVEEFCHINTSYSVRWFRKGALPFFHSFAVARYNVPKILKFPKVYVHFDIINDIPRQYIINRPYLVHLYLQGLAGEKAVDSVKYKRTFIHFLSS